MNTNRSALQYSMLLMVGVVVSNAASAESLGEIEQRLLAQETTEVAGTPTQVGVPEMANPKHSSDTTFGAEIQLKHSEMPVDMEELAMFTRWYLEGLSENEIANALRVWRKGDEQ